MAVRAITERHSRALTVRDEQLSELQTKYKLDLAKTQAEHEQKLKENVESSTKIVSDLQSQFHTIQKTVCNDRQSFADQYHKQEK